MDEKNQFKPYIQADKITPEMCDGRGTSLVCVNSHKGAKLFENIKGNLIYKEIALAEAVKYNSAMVKSSNKPQDRDEFIKLAIKNFGKAKGKYLSNNIFKRAIAKLKRTINSIMKK